MKTLTIILLLLISFSGYSQNINKKYLNLRKADTIIIKKQTPFPSTDFLLYYYDLYEKECYNDSTNVHFFKSNIFPDNCYEYEINGLSFEKGKLICKNPNHFKWIHKQPTFDGFINYLKKQ